MDRMGMAQKTQPKTVRIESTLKIRLRTAGYVERPVADRHGVGRLQHLFDCGCRDLHNSLIPNPQSLSVYVPAMSDFTTSVL